MSDFRVCSQPTTPASLCPHLQAQPRVGVSAVRNANWWLCSNHCRSLCHSLCSMCGRVTPSVKGMLDFGCLSKCVDMWFLDRYDPTSLCRVGSLLWGLGELINVPCLPCPYPPCNLAPPPLCPFGGGSFTWPFYCFGISLLLFAQHLRAIACLPVSFAPWCCFAV